MDTNMRMRLALAALLDWARENTSPLDANSPHELLIEAAAVLDETEQKPPEAPRLKFIVNGTFGPTGRRHTGYAVCSIGDRDAVAATFRNRDYASWRLAKAAAGRKCDELNRATQGATAIEP